MARSYRRRYGQYSRETSSGMETDAPLSPTNGETTTNGGTTSRRINIPSQNSANRNGST